MCDQWSYKHQTKFNHCSVTIPMAKDKNPKPATCFSPCLMNGDFTICCWLKHHCHLMAGRVSLIERLQRCSDVHLRTLQRFVSHEGNVSPWQSHKRQSWWSCGSTYLSYLPSGDQTCQFKIHHFPIQTSPCRGFSIAAFDYQRLPTLCVRNMI